MTPERRDWLIAILYVALIYGTLSLVRGPITFLREHNLLRLSLGLLYGLSLSGVAVALIRQHGLDLRRLCVFAAIFAMYYAVAGTVSQPEELIHFVQYGLAGVFFARALMHRIPTLVAATTPALILAGLAGWVDELIQGVMQTRYYDPRDVVLNLISAGLGLALYAIIVRKKTNR